MNPIDTSADCEPRGREPNPTAAGKSAGFAVIPMEMARDRRLKARHLVVLMALFHHYNAKRRQPVFPGRKKLSALTGLHMSTISAVTAELVAQGWITKSGKGGFSHATRYALNFAPTGSIAEKKTTTVSRAILATAATPSPSHCGDTPPSPQGRQDTLAIGAIRKKQSKETKEENNNPHEEVSAREKLAHDLVDFFHSSFHGLGTGTIPKDTTRVWKKWADEFLYLLDDGASHDEIKTVISWLVSENRNRLEFRFKVHDPIQLREKWPRLVEAVSKDRSDAMWYFADETPAETRMRRQKAYADDLLTTVPMDEQDDEEKIALSRLLDPRNQVPAPIAFCCCVERGLVDGLNLEGKFIESVKDDQELLKAYKKIFPGLSKEYVEELRLSAREDLVDAGQRRMK